jgi:hypothetical protein
LIACGEFAADVAAADREGKRPALKPSSTASVTFRKGIAHARNVPERNAHVRNIPERLSTDRNHPNSNHYQFLTNLVARSLLNLRRSASVEEEAGQRHEWEFVMAQATLAAMPNTLGATRARPAPRLATTFGDVRKILKSLFDPYRPERHYMRGPGPKWREKHGDKSPAL